jgi:CheY-like chemotaxis protein
MVKKVLFIDDESDLRGLFRIFMSMIQGVECHEACDGREGVEVAKRIKPDIIIMDYKMPVMNGIDALKLLKSSVLTEHIPVIMHTAYASDADILRAMELGCAEVLNKPVDIRGWEAKLREYVGY